MKGKYAPLSLEFALLGQADNWCDERKTWSREKRRSDGTLRVSRPRTPAEDRDLRDRYGTLLDRYEPHHKHAKAQAGRLQNCSRRNPCGDSGCPACLGAFQHGFVRVATRFMKRADKTEGDIFAVSLVPSDEVVKRSGLAGLDLLNFHRRTRARLKALIPHCAWIMLGIDISLNQDEQKRWKPKWSPHLYGFLQTRLPRKHVKAKLKEVFPAKVPLVRRPVKVRPFEPSRYGASYIIKTDFQRRITYPHSRGERSKKAPLRSGHRAELQQILVWLSETRISNRLLLIGLRTIRTRRDVKLVRANASFTPGFRVST